MRKNNVNVQVFFGNSCGDGCCGCNKTRPNSTHNDGDDVPDIHIPPGGGDDDHHNDTSHDNPDEICKDDHTPHGDMHGHRPHVDDDDQDWTEEKEIESQCEDFDKKRQDSDKRKGDKSAHHEDCKNKRINKEKERDDRISECAKNKSDRDNERARINADCNNKQKDRDDKRDDHNRKQQVCSDKNTHLTKRSYDISFTRMVRVNSCNAIKTNYQNKVAQRDYKRKQCSDTTASRIAKEKERDDEKNRCAQRQNTRKSNIGGKIAARDQSQADYDKAKHDYDNQAAKCVDLDNQVKQYIAQGRSRFEIEAKSRERDDAYYQKDVFKRDHDYKHGRRQSLQYDLEDSEVDDNDQTGRENNNLDYLHKQCNDLKDLETRRNQERDNLERECTALEQNVKDSDDDHKRKTTDEDNELAQLRGDCDKANSDRDEAKRLFEKAISDCNSANDDRTKKFKEFDDHDHSERNDMDRLRREANTCKDDEKKAKEDLDKCTGDNDKDHHNYNDCFERLKKKRDFNQSSPKDTDCEPVKPNCRAVCYRGDHFRGHKIEICNDDDVKRFNDEGWAYKVRSMKVAKGWEVMCIGDSSRYEAFKVGKWNDISGIGRLSKRISCYRGSD